MKVKSPRRWLLWYALSLGALTALALWAALRVPGYRNPGFNFYAMRSGEYFDVAGLTRRQGGSLKLGFAESYAPPPVAAFGNHILNYFGADAFGGTDQAEQFFNYSYANVSLPELVQFITDVEAHGHLPSRLMIVGLTPPNADNGHYIIDHGNELPPGILLYQVGRAGAHANSGAAIDALWQTVDTWIHEVYSYNTLLLGLAQDGSRSHLTGPTVCREAGAKAATSWVDKLPWTVRNLVDPGASHDRCDPAAWNWTVRRDGARVITQREEPVANDDPQRASDRGLRAGDERKIADYLKAIDAIGRRNNVKVVFLITPVFETDRHDSVVNQVMDKALALAPDLDVIDDRSRHDDPALFVNSLHPGPAYFAQVAAELRKRGLVAPDPQQAPADLLDQDRPAGAPGSQPADRR